MSVSDRLEFSSWNGPARTYPHANIGMRNRQFSVPYNANVDSLAVLQTKSDLNITTAVGQRWGSLSPAKKDAVQSLESQLQRIIDEELATAVPLGITDPEDTISRHMEASLKLWNKLTEIRNNYKTELKKKQEERVSFENDIRLATIQTTAELALIEHEIERTNQEICSMEGQISDAENYRKKIEEETNIMEEELKCFAAEDDILQKELNEINKAIQTVEASISQAETDFYRHESDAGKELLQLENVYSKKIEIKDQQIAASTIELEQLEHDLNEFERSNPEEAEITHLKEEIQKTKMENDMIKAEMKQVHQSNIEIRRNGEHLLAADEEKLRREQLANQAENERITQEIQCFEKKLRTVEEHLQNLEQQRIQLSEQTMDTEKGIDRMQSEIQSIKFQLREKENTMKDICQLIDKQEALEQEMEEKYNENVRQLERQTDNKIRDIKNQMTSCVKKKKENMARIRKICRKVKESKEKLMQAEVNAQDTFRKLKCLTEEYEILQKQNERNEKFIAFYDTIRSQETKYVELKSVLSRAKDQRDFLKIKERERQKDAITPQSVRPALQKCFVDRHEDNAREWPKTKSTSMMRDFRDDFNASRRISTKDHLADPFIQVFLKVNKVRNKSRKCC